MIKSREGSVWKRKIRRIMNQEKDPSTFCCFTDPAAESKNQNKIGNRIKRKRYPFLSYHELPDYMKDNEYILNYYRADWPLKIAFISLFQWHNETLNVWTHLLGFLLFVVLTVANVMNVPRVADFITRFTGQLPSSAEANISNKLTSVGPTKLVDLKQELSLKLSTTTSENATPNWPFYVFLSGSMFCLLSSTICHLFCCHSRRLNTYLVRLDYIGITVMIVTSFFPPIYYIFQCTPHWQIFYLTLITIMGVCTVITLLTPALSSGKCRSFRVLLFVCMGLFGLIPAVHAAIANWNDRHRNVTLAYESVMALSYLIGTMFYVSRVPERWMPGCFDLAGQSHQIFHVFVMLGALAHYGAAQIFLACRRSMGCHIGA